MPRGRPREFDAERALDAAMLLFWKHGYEGTSLAALSDAMGVNMPSLYSAFGNKEALFHKVLDRYLGEHACYLPNALKQPTARDVVKALFKGATDLAMDRHNPDGCLLVHGALATGPSGESVRAALSGRRAAAEEAVCKRFKHAKTSGDLSAATNVSQLAGYIMTLIWGMSVQAAGGATRAQLQNTAELVLKNWPPSL